MKHVYVLIVMFLLMIMSINNGFPFSEHPYKAPKWSFDDSKLLVDYDGQFHVVSAEDNDIIRRGNGYSSSWSSDGNKIAYVRDMSGSKSQIVIYTITDQSEVNLTIGKYTENYPCWIGNTHIAFVRIKPDHSLYSFENNNCNLIYKSLSTFHEWDLDDVYYYPMFYRDNLERLFYLTYKSSVEQFYSVIPNGSYPSRMIESDFTKQIKNDKHLLYPSVDNEGKYIAFQVASGHNSTIYVYEYYTDRIISKTESTQRSSYLHPSISPDANYIAYTEKKIVEGMLKQFETKSNIIIENISTSSKMRIEGNVDYPAWSHNNDQLAYIYLEDSSKKFGIAQNPFI